MTTLNSLKQTDTLVAIFEMIGQSSKQVGQKFKPQLALLWQWRLNIAFRVFFRCSQKDSKLSGSFISYA